MSEFESLVFRGNFFAIALSVFDISWYNYISAISLFVTVHFRFWLQFTIILSGSSSLHHGAVPIKTLLSVNRMS